MLKQEESHRRETNKQMETEQKQINKICFDKETKQKIQRSTENNNKGRQERQSISHLYLRERKLLYFIGKFDKKEVPVTEFQTGEVIPGKYKNR